MRAPTALAAVALAGAVLLGGAAQALAGGNDDTGMGSSAAGNSGGGFGNTSHDKSHFDFDPKGAGFGQVGGIFDRSTGD
ncbi:hypothetical protein ACVB8X_03770 [Streptomyces sp. NRAIS4]